MILTLAIEQHPHLIHHFNGIKVILMKKKSNY
jgi:hypothetical protein